MVDNFGTSGSGVWAEEPFAATLVSWHLAPTTCINTRPIWAEQHDPALGCCEHESDEQGLVWIRCVHVH
jgi:hypothetical protein